MPTLPDFRLETHFSKWEFKARYHLTASDAESISMRDLLAMATPEEREDFEGMWLGYTETWGRQTCARPSRPPTPASRRNPSSASPARARASSQRTT